MVGLGCHLWRATRLYKTHLLKSLESLDRSAYGFTYTALKYVSR